MFFGMLMPGPELAQQRGQAEQFRQTFANQPQESRMAKLDRGNYAAFNRTWNGSARWARRSPPESYSICLVPEDRRTAGLITDISVRENVTLPSLGRFAQAGLISFDKERKKAEEMCDKLNVKAPSVEVKAADLSGGNPQEVVLAKWLALEPKVLIATTSRFMVKMGVRSITPACAGPSCTRRWTRPGYNGRSLTTDFTYSGIARSPCCTA